jgi:outer membrane protein assembly factor BamB
MQTPLVYGQELYLLSDAGVLACLDLVTGDPHYRERVGEGQTGFTASMVAGDGKLYATSEEGTVSVIQAGTTFAVLARHELGETCMATPAISAGTIYWRTRSQLVAIAARDQ